jgi:uncharacterized protein YcaQ
VDSEVNAVVRSTVTATTLRRIALQCQGLTGKRKLVSGSEGTLCTLEHLGYIQIDAISVVARAHHHTLWSRVGGYLDDHVNQLIKRHEAFEYWYHAASFLPMRDYQFALPRMRSFARGEHRWMLSRDKALIRRVLDRVREEGPLRVRDFENPSGRQRGWSSWKPAKRALEQLFMQGDLMCAGRDGFEKIYDLAERVLPSNAVTTEPSLDAIAAHLIKSVLRAHGFATPKSFTYGRRGTPLRAAVKMLLTNLTRRGDLAAVAAPNGETIYGELEIFDQRPNQPPSIVRILSPFDNSIIQRARTQVIHDFDYRLECYVTSTQRKWGYFCLPILFRDRFVGRMDCKAHRDGRIFEVKHLHIEDSLTDDFDAAFAIAVLDYASYNRCDTIKVTRVSPRFYSSRFKRCLTHTPNI